MNRPANPVGLGWIERDAYNEPKGPGRTGPEVETRRAEDQGPANKGTTALFFEPKFALDAHSAARKFRE